MTIPSAQAIDWIRNNVGGLDESNPDQAYALTEIAIKVRYAMQNLR